MTDTGKVKSRVFTAMPDEPVKALWNEFLGRTPLSTQYTSPGFFVDPFLEGKDRLAVLAFDDFGDVQGVMTAISAEGKTLSGLPSRPQIAIAKGADTIAVTRALCESLIDACASQNEVEIYTWDTLPADFGALFSPIRSSPLNEVVVLDLSRGKQALFSSFSQTRRSELRKAERDGLISISRLTQESEAEELYRIHTIWNDSKGSPPSNRQAFLNAVLDPASRLTLVAKYNGAVIAGSFFRICNGGMIEYAANNSLREFQHLRPNDILCWQAIQIACDEGFRYMSMGGAHLFLRRFGGEIWTTHGYCRDQTLFQKYRTKRFLAEKTQQLFMTIPEQYRAAIKARLPLG